MGLETAKQKRELREREKLKSTEVGLREAAGMRARLCEGKLSMGCGSRWEQGQKGDLVSEMKWRLQAL